MIKLNTKLAAGAALSAVLLAGCGGGGGGGGGGVANSSCSDIQTIPSGSVVAFNQQVIANTSENTQPIDITCLTLATDDTVDFTPII